MPGIGEVIDGAMQQAPQPGRQERGESREAMVVTCKYITVTAAAILDGHYPRVYIS
jgi:hypothetical protein